MAKTRHALNQRRKRALKRNQLAAAPVPESRIKVSPLTLDFSQIPMTTRRFMRIDDLYLDPDPVLLKNVADAAQKISDRMKELIYAADVLCFSRSSQRAPILYNPLSD